MARADTLELLGSLIDRLEPLGRMSPAQPIRADDWNSLVDAVRTVARVAVARERTTDQFLDERYARGDHRHLGQITLEWFDPPARALLEENIQGAVTQRAEVQRTRGELAELRGSVEEMKRNLNDLRIDLDGLRDSDAARGNEVGRVAVRVESLRDVETRVSTLDQRLGSIATNVEAALEFRNELQDETGQPIDIRAFGGRIAELEGLRANLQTANGELVQIRSIESAIARLEENAIGRSDIEDAVTGRLRDPATLEQSGLIGAVREQVEGALSGRLTGLDQAAAALSTEIAGVRGSLAAQDTRLGQQEGRLANAEGQIGALAVLPERLNQQGARLTDVEARTQANQAALADVAALRTQLDQVRTDVTGLQGLNATVAVLDGRMGEVEASTAAIDTLVTSTQSNASRLAAIEAGLPALNRAAVTVGEHTATLGQLNTRLQANEAQLDNLARVPAQIDSMTAQLRGFSDFQISATQRLNELSTRTAGLAVLTERVAATERLAAENRNSLARVNTDISGLTGRIDRIDPNLIVRPVRPIG
ncbi:MAG: hypothetical protein WD696_11950 [Bryobacteraceae bacterium]